MHSEENGSLRFAIMPSPGTPTPLLVLLLRAYGFIGAFRA